MTPFLATPIEFLKGVGPLRGELLRKEISVYCYADLLNYFPFRFVDRSQYNTINQINVDSGNVQLKGKVTHIEEVGDKRKKRLVAIFHDETGTIELIWFAGIKYVKANLRANELITVYGKPSFFNGRATISHPEVEKYRPVTVHSKKIQPIYHSTEKLTSKGLHSKGIERLTEALVKEIDRKIPSNLNGEIEQELHLISRMMIIH